MSPWSTIQSRMAPRTGRVALPSNSPALSSEEGTVAEIRCQKSDATIDTLQINYENPGTNLIASSDAASSNEILQTDLALNVL